MRACHYLPFLLVSNVVLAAVISPKVFLVAFVSVAELSVWCHVQNKPRYSTAMKEMLGMVFPNSTSSRKTFLSQGCL